MNNCNNKEDDDTGAIMNILLVVFVLLLISFFFWVTFDEMSKCEPDEVLTTKEYSQKVKEDNLRHGK